MERYAQKLRELKMRKARDRLGQATSEPPPIDIDEDLGAQDMVSAVTKALAQRWVRMARDHLESKFRNRSETFREDLQSILQQMPEEDDW